MDANGYHGAGVVRGRGSSTGAQETQQGHNGGRGGQQGQVNIGGPQTGRGGQPVPIQQPIPIRPVAPVRGSIIGGVQQHQLQAIGPEPGQPVRVTSSRGLSRQASNSENRTVPASKAPPRPPRSPHSTMPPPTGPMPSLPTAATAALAALAAEEAKEPPDSPDTSVHSSTAVGSDKQKQARVADKHRSLSELYTFLREPTPPPPLPPAAAFAPGQRFNDGVPSTPAPEYYDYKYDHVAPPAPLPTGVDGTICGVRKRLFWLLLAAAVLAIVIAVGVGAGVGVATKSNSSKDKADSQDGASNNDITTTITTTLALSTTTPPDATSTDSSTTSLPTATTKLGCPDANNTIYDVPGSPKNFLRICGIDHDGAAQARDIGSVWTATMEDCMINCAGFSGCTACGWGAIAGDPGSEHRCWLKNNLTDAYQYRTGWQFAILE